MRKQEVGDFNLELIESGIHLSVATNKLILMRQAYESELNECRAKMLLNKKQDVNRGIIFWSLPEILIIDLKRWGERGQKIHTLVSAPLNNADFTTFVQGYNKQSYLYDLFGVYNHSGGSLGGHYTACVKNANGKWYTFNDTNVSEITDTDIISKQSYCFFYRKKKISQ